MLVDLTGEPGRLAFADRPLTSGQLPDAWRHFTGAVLEPVFGLLRTLVTCRALNGTRVLLVTEADGEPAPVLRGLHSLVRTVAGETSRISPRLATVDAAWAARDPRGAAAAVAAEAAGRVPAGEDWVLLGADGARRTAVLTPEPPLAAAEPAQLLDPRGTYLVVGGLGGLGRQIASAIRAARPTAKLVLVGRSAPDAVALEALQRQDSRGSVTYRQCDVTDPRQLTELCAALERSGKHLRGVAYTAGVLRDGFLRTKDPRTVEEVCRAKALGAVAVDAAFADHPLDFFVVASSLAALVGNQGQSDYAFANGFLDGFARARARWVEQGHRRGRTLSVGWPVLDGAGMAPEPAALDYLTDTYGLQPVSAAAAVTGMWPRIAAATEPGAAHVALVAGDQSVWCEALGVSAEAATETTQTVQSAQTPEPSAPVADPRAAVTDWLAQRVGQAIGVPAAMIGADRPLPEYGVDSIAVMRLGRILEDDLGRVPLALLLDSNTLTEMAERLLARPRCRADGRGRCRGTDGADHRNARRGAGVHPARRHRDGRHEHGHRDGRHRTGSRPLGRRPPGRLRAVRRVRTRGRGRRDAPARPAGRNVGRRPGRRTRGPVQHLAGLAPRGRRRPRRPERCRTGLGAPPPGAREQRAAAPRRGLLRPRHGRPRPGDPAAADGPGHGGSRAAGGGPALRPLLRAPAASRAVGERRHRRPPADDPPPRRRRPLGRARPAGLLGPLRRPHRPGPAAAARPPCSPTPCAANAVTPSAATPTPRRSGPVG
ncbi:hypothetical protein GCM10020000_75570 [Streptomyces olivoverticillatus]